ncbi:MAG: PQQ-binding-like beta-propeller repeat protein [Fimbriimonas sp.]
MLALFLAAAALVSPPIPPFKKMNAVELGEYQGEFMTSGNVAFSCGNDGISAFALPSLKRLWFKPLGGKDLPRKLAADKSNVYISTAPEYRTTRSRVVALNRISGSILWSMDRSGSETAMLAEAGFLYLSPAPGKLAKINLKTRKPVWTTALTAVKTKDSFRSDELESLVKEGNRLLVQLGNNVTYGIDASSGRVAYHYSPSYLFSQSLVTYPGVLFIPSESMVARSSTTDKVLWKGGDYGDAAVIFKGRLCTLEHGTLVARDPLTGKIAWSEVVGPSGTSGGYQYLSPMGDVLIMRSIDQCVSWNVAGKKLWTLPKGHEIGVPIWADAKYLVCMDGNRILSYIHGEAEPMPTTAEGRAKLAKSLVARFSSLDESETRLLESLGSEAFDALLGSYLALAKQYAAAVNKDNGESYPIYSKMSDMGRVLTVVTTRAETKKLVDAIRQLGPKGAGADELLQLVAQKGDPALSTPLFLEQLRAKDPDHSYTFDGSTVALQAVANSSEPEAVRYMIALLKDPKAPGDSREMAYTNLSRTGGEAGLKAVLEERSKRTPLQPLAARLELDKASEDRKKRPVSRIVAKHGTGVALIQSGVLGNFTDYWLVTQKDGAWTSPVFTGLSESGISTWVKPKRPEPVVGGFTGPMLAKSDWFKLLDNPALTSDQDHDGLTDLVEARLGTNAKAADTDGDGLGDELDPWPNVAPREQSDAEQVLAAAWEAKYHFFEAESPALFTGPKDLKPFEMVGWKGPVIWRTQTDDHWGHPLSWNYEHGIAIADFDQLDRTATAWEPSLIRWNKDRTEAAVQISTYYGGLNGSGYLMTLKKFGTEWVVTSSSMAYVS